MKQYLHHIDIRKRVHPQSKTHQKCFISHCSDDNELMNGLLYQIDAIFRNHLDRYCTFRPDDSIIPGKDVFDELQEQLRNSDYMLSIITDSYLRSEICLAELSSFWFQQKPVIALIFNGETGIGYVKKIFGDKIFIDAKNDGSKPAVLFLKALSNHGAEPACSADSAEKRLTEFFRDSTETIPSRPFIGSGESYEKIFTRCAKYGITQVADYGLKTRDLVEQLTDCTDIFILSTTGANLINGLSSEFIPTALSRGVNFTIMLPNRYSSFCNDVAELEQPVTKAVNVKRFAIEYEGVIANLINASHASKAEKAGSIYIANTFTLLRQTIILGLRPDHTAWAWVSVTMPPKRTNDKTLSFECSGRIDSDSMIGNVYHHIQSVCEFAKRHEAFDILTSESAVWIDQKYDMGIGTDKLEYFLNQQVEYRNWIRKLYLATDTMTTHRENGNGVLIEIAAQHPLKKDGTPSDEFRCRLDHGIGLYHQYKEKYSKVRIYVPGSLHRYDGVIDSQPLSTAGTTYLRTNGIPEEDLYGEECNLRYKGEDGVYNSADECFVASQIFQDENFALICSVCSPNQLTRKQLFYMQFNVLPRFYTAPYDSMAHNLINELFETIPDVLFRDHNWQAPDSVNGNRTRKERNPIL